MNLVNHTAQKRGLRTTGSVKARLRVYAENACCGQEGKIVYKHIGRRASELRMF